MNAFIVVNVIERHAKVSHQQCVRGKNGGRNRRGSVNWEEGADCGELVADFFFLNVKETSDVLNHLFMGKGQFITSRAAWQGRSDGVRGAASTVNRGRRTGWNEDGGR